MKEHTVSKTNSVTASSSEVHDRMQHRYRESAQTHFDNARQWKLEVVRLSGRARVGVAVPTPRLLARVRRSSRED